MTGALETSPARNPWTAAAAVKTQFKGLVLSISCRPASSFTMKGLRTLSAAATGLGAKGALLCLDV